MTDIETALYNALQVLLHDQTILLHLQRNDPQALLQSLAAISAIDEQAAEYDDWSVEEEQLHERRAHACDR